MLFCSASHLGMEDERCREIDHRGSLLFVWQSKCGRQLRIADREVGFYAEKFRPCKVELGMCIQTHLWMT